MSEVKFIISANVVWRYEKDFFQSAQNQQCIFTFKRVSVRVYWDIDMIYLNDQCSYYICWLRKNHKNPALGKILIQVILYKIYNIHIY